MPLLAEQKHQVVINNFWDKLLYFFSQGIKIHVIEKNSGGSEEKSGTKLSIIERLTMPDCIYFRKISTAQGIALIFTKLLRTLTGDQAFSKYNYFNPFRSL